MGYNQADKIQEHYDLGSPLYVQLWGTHIHHGYFEHGNESKEEAQEKLITLLIAHGRVKNGSRVLDVGCGVGGTALRLAKEMDCRVVGISISPVQIQMANEAAVGVKNAPHFLVGDANDLQIQGEFDVIWAVEMISHVRNREGLFKNFSKLLSGGGRICIAAWLKDDCIIQSDERKYIEPIESGMLVDLPDFSEYKKYAKDNGLRFVYYEDISARVAKTWDISAAYLKDRALWRMARTHPKEFTSFVKSFHAIRTGFKAGAFRYGVMVLEKPQ